MTFAYNWFVKISSKLLFLERVVDYTNVINLIQWLRCALRSAYYSKRVVVKLSLYSKIWEMIMQCRDFLKRSRKLF